ncbi:MAG TPA: TonB-dependent receptor [Candidatus Polarisedimenticolaceae bacterium]
MKRSLLVALGLLAGRAFAGTESQPPPVETDLVETVEVSSTVAKDRESPASFSDLDAARIVELHRGQDLGMLLGDTVNAYAYSDAGNGVGYSYLSIRGFNQQRIAVNVNGVPLNTPENRAVYFIDLADFAGSLDRVQVQRGPGTALYGAPAVGGAVNLETGNVPAEAGGRLVVGGGSYGTTRLSVQYGGPLGNTPWAWAARVARVASDGYRDPSWTRHTIGSVAFQRFDEDSVWKILLFGGPEQTQLAYFGVPRECLDGSAGSCDRRTNFLVPGETDTFVQPQLQVHNDRRLREGWLLRNTAYAILGRGHYLQYSGTYDYRPTGFEPPTPEYPEATLSDVWRKRAVYNTQLGWIPRVTWDHGRGTLTAGAELLAHEGRHRGRVESGSVCTGAPEDPCSATQPLEGQPVLYAYDNRKTTATVFVREQLRPTTKVGIHLELQATRHRYAMRDDAVRDYRYDASYAFLAPRAGVHWNVDDRWELWVQGSASQSEPYFNHVWNPQETFDDPTSRFERYDPGTRELSDPIARPERLRSVEGGVGYVRGATRLKASLYRMSFRDEFVFAGGIDEDGVPITENAGRSVHRGVEVEGAVRLPGEVDLSGYAAFSDDELIEYRVLAPREDGSVATLDYGGNRVALFPESMLRLRAARTFGRVRVEAGARRVGTLYTDNSENERKRPELRAAPGWTDKRIAPYVVADLRAAVDLGRKLTLRVWVDNLLDEEYETIGYSYPLDPDATAFYTEFFPAATRNVFASLTWEF